MSQKHNTGRADKDIPHPKGGSDLVRVLVVVKAPPHISQRYDETVCTAGITGSGKWIRLYPINFRDLPKNQRFKKYQWLRVEVEKHSDFRPESYRPKISTIKLGETLDTKNNWGARKKILYPLRVESMEKIYKNYQESATSLAIFKPKRIIDLIAVPAQERTARQLRKQNQLLLFGPNPKPLDHIEYRFKYKFTCNDATCTEHTLTIEDWEIQELYRSAREKFGPFAIDKILAYIKKKWLEEMWSEKKDGHLIVGSVNHTNSFIILGVFWPNKD